MIDGDKNLYDMIIIDEVEFECVMYIFEKIIKNLLDAPRFSKCAKELQNIRILSNSMFYSYYCTINEINQSKRWHMN